MRGGGVEDHEVAAGVGEGVVVGLLRVEGAGAAAVVELLRELVVLLFSSLDAIEEEEEEQRFLTARMTAGLGARFLGT